MSSQINDRTKVVSKLVDIFGEADGPNLTRFVTKLDGFIGTSRFSKVMVHRRFTSNGKFAVQFYDVTRGQDVLGNFFYDFISNRIDRIS